MMKTEDAIIKIRSRKKYLINLINMDLKHCPDNVTGQMARIDAEDLIKALEIL